VEWFWRYEDESGNEAEASTLTGAPTQPSTGFPSQGDAESWVGENWQELLEAGVDGVILFDGERRVYGPMSLRPQT
jgi:hypothetical protein